MERDCDEANAQRSCDQPFAIAIILAVLAFFVGLGKFLS